MYYLLHTLCVDFSFSCAFLQSLIVRLYPQTYQLRTHWGYNLNPKFIFRTHLLEGNISAPKIQNFGMDSHFEFIDI